MDRRQGQAVLPCSLRSCTRTWRSGGTPSSPLPRFSRPRLRGTIADKAGEERRLETAIRKGPMPRRPRLPLGISLHSPVPGPVLYDQPAGAQAEVACNWGLGNAARLGKVVDRRSVMDSGCLDRPSA